MTLSELEYEEANARMRRLQKSGAVVSAKYQRSTRRVVVELVTGVQLSISADRVEGPPQCATAGAGGTESIPGRFLPPRCWTPERAARGGELGTASGVRTSSRMGLDHGALA